MPKAQARNSSLPPGWTEIMDNIQLSLTETLGEATERERLWEEECSQHDPNQYQRVLGLKGLNKLDEQLLRFHGCCQRAEEKAAEVEAFLQKSMNAVQEWQAAAESLRQRLANWQARFIK